MNYVDQLDGITPVVVSGPALGVSSEAFVGKQPTTAVCRRLQLKFNGTR